MATRSGVPAVLWILLVLLAPVSVSGYGQYGGDQNHSGDAAQAIGAGPLDIRQVDTAAVSPLSSSTGPGVISIGDRYYALSSEGGTCTVESWNRTRAPSTAFTVDCPEGGRLLGASQGKILLCIPGVPGEGDGVLRAIHPQTAEAWGLDPARPQIDPVSVLGLLGDSVTPILFTWGCGHVAIGDEILVAFADQRGNHTIEAVSLDGQRRWATQVPLGDLLAGGAPVPLPPIDDAEGVLGNTAGATGGFVPNGVTLTDTGILVTGRLSGVQGTNAPPAAAWIAPNGTVMGAIAYNTDPAGAGSVLVPASRHATADRGRAATIMGEHVFVVNPIREQGALVEVGSTTFSAPSLAGPAWGSMGLVAPTETGALLFSDDLTTPSRWSGFDGARVQQILTGARDAWAVLTTPQSIDEPERVELLRFDTAHGRTLQYLPTTLTAPAGDGQSAGLIPTSSGLLVWTQNGGLAWLDPSGGTTNGEPDAATLAVSVQGAYPAIGAPVTIRYETDAAPNENTTIIVAWGDGRVDVDPAPATLQHAYESAGEHEVVLTVAVQDGRTVTRSTIVHVGGTPPEELGLLEQAFSPENQEVTFAVIGFSLSAIGLTVGLLATLRGRRRLERELKSLDRIRERGRIASFDAVRELHGFRLRIRRDMARGRLNDAQYAVLRDHVRDALEVMRERILGGFASSVSASFARTLDVALRDGSIDEEEAELLLASAKTEAMEPADRRRLANLIQSWQGT